MYKPSKYHAEKVTVAGITFDSRAEADRYRQLVLLQRGGYIQDLQRQVRFKLIPAQRRDDGRLERGADYIADFVYTENGKTIVEDVKGYKTPEYILKRKLMLMVHGITVKEVI